MPAPPACPPARERGKKREREAEGPGAGRTVAGLLEAVRLVVVRREHDDVVPAALERHRRVHHQPLRAACEHERHSQDIRAREEFGEGLGKRSGGLGKRPGGLGDEVESGGDSAEGWPTARRQR